MKILRIPVLCFVFSFLLCVFTLAQDKYTFTIEKEMKATSVKIRETQALAGILQPARCSNWNCCAKGLAYTCFSEMFIIRYAYVEKAILYVRLHGKCNFGQGGESHDVINIMRKYGMVPRKIYNGRKDSDRGFDHSQLETDLRSYLDTLIKKNTDKMPADWLKAYEKLLDKDMGKVPKKFKYDKETYTPLTYLKNKLKINPDDFIEFTSFNHHPFYEKFFLEIPDNWAFNLYNNVPLDELISIIDTCISKGYTVGWGGDVSEKGFSAFKSLAIVPAKDWKNKSDEEKRNTLEVPEKEAQVTQEMRQKAFDNYTTTDDHFMQITGIAKGPEGH